MPGKVFLFKHLVYFHETNSMGGVVYFSNYVKWQGMVREEFFLMTVPQWKPLMREVISGNLNMLTAEEYSRFIKHSFFGDDITIKIYASDIKKLSFKVIFEMTKNNESDLIYSGWQKLAFEDRRGNFVPIPEPLLAAVLDYAPVEEVMKYKTTYSIDGKDLVVGKP